MPRDPRIEGQHAFLDQSEHGERRERLAAARDREPGLRGVGHPQRPVRVALAALEAPIVADVDGHDPGE